MSSPLIREARAAEPVREVLHGIEVEDPFRWLEEPDTAATRRFIGSQQEAYREYLDLHRELRSRIEPRVRELLSVPSIDLPVPDHRGGLVYLKRAAAEEQKAIYDKDGAGSEGLLLSVAMLHRDDQTSLAILQISSEGRHLAFGTRTGGEDLQEIGIYDLWERRILPDRLARGFFRGLVFDSNQTGFYYAHEDADGLYAHRRAVRWHSFNSDPRNDSEVFDAGEGPGLRLVLREAEDASALGYLIVSLDCARQTRFLLHRIPVAAPPKEIVQLSGVTFGPRFRGGLIEAATTEAAPHGRIVRISMEDSAPGKWRDVIPEAPERLDSWELWGNLRVVHYAAGSQKLTRLYTVSGELLRTIQYPSSGTSTPGRVDSSSGRLFYAHSDVDKPPAIRAVDLRTGRHQVWWEPPNPVRPGSITIDRHTFPSKDGTTIPITLIHSRETKGVRPVLLTAYGGGGVSATPTFSALRTILVEAGFVCVIAHVRGGGEGGIEWHASAIKQRKQTSVDDLLHAADWLIANGYAVAKHLGVAGQSNGALLALCAITQQPGLFRAALALGPLADLARFHLFGVARGSVTELGSPDNPADFEALLRLSPYHQVRKGARYPAVLLVSGDRDKRCDALHARKMIARLQAAALPCHPILLDYTAMRGHKPVQPLSERIRALTDRLTFLVAELAIHSQEAPLS